jgi:hypothetical protein
MKVRTGYRYDLLWRPITDVLDSPTLHPLNAQIVMINDTEYQRFKSKVDDVTKPFTVRPSDDHRFAEVFHGDNRLSIVMR